MGNRLTQETLAGTNTYTYDIANRLIGVDGLSYAWSDNGNLLSDGASTYTYDHAHEASPKRIGGGNRLSTIAQGDDTYSYVYPAQNMRGERQRPGRSLIANRE